MDCANPAPDLKMQPMMCVSSTPAPTTFNNWDAAFMPGNDFTGIQFGGYYSSVPVAFHPSLGACIGKTGHDLVADAATLSAAIQSAYNTWKSSNNAAQVENLLSSYAAGEIGAAAFIAGSVDLLGVGVISLVIVGTGLTLYSLVAVAECVLSNDSVGYFWSPHLLRPLTA